MAFLNPQQLREMGFLSVGANVCISEKASIYGASRIRIGSNVRVDDFSILSAGEGGIEMGSYVHIACYVSLIGKERITLGDFAGLSARVSVYSSSDDYSGAALTNPTVPDEFKKVDHRPVVIGRHCIVGAGAIILPGVTLEDGSAVSALALVTKDCEAFTIYGGVPARKIKPRERRLLDLEREFLSRESASRG
jgi:dTDP-4-amino-4,6-dideoxy-D-glucose acyltransferase